MYTSDNECPEIGKIYFWHQEGIAVRTWFPLKLCLIFMFLNFIFNINLPRSPSFSLTKMDEILTARKVLGKNIMEKHHFRSTEIKLLTVQGTFC